MLPRRGVKVKPDTDRHAQESPTLYIHRPSLDPDCRKVIINLCFFSLQDSFPSIEKIKTLSSSRVQKEKAS